MHDLEDEEVIRRSDLVEPELVIRESSLGKGPA
jgi:hypothetical protein